MKEWGFVRLPFPSRKRKIKRCIKWFACFLLLLTLIVSCFFIEGFYDNGEWEGPPLSPKQSSSLSNGKEKKLEYIPTDEGNAELPGLFTILLLVDKAPHSLKNTLRSLKASGLLNHPRFYEIVIYKKLIHKKTIKLEESNIFTILWGDQMKDKKNNNNNNSNFSRRLRVMGDSSKESMAKSTIAAIHAVRTQYVLYMECDKPVYTFPFGVKAIVTPETFTPSNAFPHKARDALHLYIKSFITLALQHLDKKNVHVFRLQLYASRLLRNQKKEIDSKIFLTNNTQMKKMTAEDLPTKTYGEDPYKNCHLTPKFHLPSEFCTWDSEKRENYSSAFSLSYCKNWNLFIDATKPYSGLCNAMCSKEWITTGKRRNSHLSEWNSSKGKESPLWQFFQEKHPTNQVDFVASDTTEGITEDFLTRLREINLETVVTPQGFMHDLLCFPSSLCGWTNQPALYARSWFLNLVAQKCKTNNKMCLIQEGNEPGVLLEDFVTERQSWKNDLFHICISDGLFINYAFEP